MVGGGGNMREEGSMKPTIQNTNLFAALDTRRKKKKSVKVTEPVKEAEPQVFWAPTPLKAKAWADIDSDDEDEDYFATTAPPPPHSQTLWSASQASEAKEVHVEVRKV
ncbi:unnamed protein product [Eruca vesicaria subsp. sativa]|uniref:Uncharacterized protein n=1 Tax=Eruca vesicaria subsp. sativa TaxID=29727 RepID=A0ABC8KVR8_ERUVS|nr:unnamed protein product [Eruca vesicaria subsp. sativa]